jgi:hypothetical protein
VRRPTTRGPGSPAASGTYCEVRRPEESIRSLRTQQRASVHSPANSLAFHP